MRDIKFRAWDKTNNRMRLNLAEDGFFISPNNGNIVTPDNYSLYFGDRLILLQYTGILDKNGNEIYEGDIIEKRYDTPFVKERLSKARGVVEYGTFSLLEELGEVKRSVTGWFIEFEDKSGKIPVTNEFEVIGNVYENSDKIHGRRN